MMLSALRREDLVWAKLDVHKRRVERSLGVSFSGGKDSSCVLDLVRREFPAAPVAFFDSGCELDSTMEIVHAERAEIVVPRMSILDMARYAGWWDYERPTDKGCAFDAKRVIIEEPSEAFVVRRGLRAIAHGVRAEESPSRGKHIGLRGELYLGADRTWYCMPLAQWKIEDVWAYIASRELRYNAAYDTMADAGIERRDQRVATLLGNRGAGWGRHAFLKRFSPDRWRQIVAEFPGLARDS